MSYKITQLLCYKRGKYNTQIVHFFTVLLLLTGSVFLPKGVTGGSYAYEQEPVTITTTTQTFETSHTEVTETWKWPAKGYITTKYSVGHPGIDIVNPFGPDIFAANNGIVRIAGWTDTGYGNYVVVEHDNGWKTLYGHMSKIYVKVGDKVAQGQELGRMGSTGRSTGTHLHFEIHTLNGTVNPFAYLQI